MESVFWISVAFVAYVYVGYPVLLAISVGVARRLSPARARRSSASLAGASGGGGTVALSSRVRSAGRPKAASRSAELPRVSVVIAARDEARRLPQRIENLLESDYPKERMQIIVASDGSTDDTSEVLAPYADVVQLLMLPPSGKATALNAAVALACHPILVFADARQRFAPDAIRRLVSHFGDPQIGAVSGELVLDCETRGGADDSTMADGVGAYWRYEKWLRRHEAEVGSTVGVTGAIYAMRRWLWQPLPPDTLLDDVLTPMRVVLRGYLVTFDGSALAFDEVSRDGAGELRRKVRTLAGNFQLLAREPRLLVPGSNPVWLQFVSHKIGRLLVPYALLALLVASGVLAARSVVYALAFSGQLLFYGLAIYGGLLDQRARRRQVTANEVVREAA